MDDLNNPSAYEDLGPHRRLTSPDGERPWKREPHPKTQRLIGELGLRYPPASSADLEEHAARLALLTADVADISPDILERAIADHVAKSPFMPKASELRDIARELSRSRAKPDLQALCDRYNSEPNRQTTARWIVDGDNVRLESTMAPRSTSPRQIRVTEAEIIAYAKAGHRARKTKKA